MRIPNKIQVVVVFSLSITACGVGSGSKAVDDAPSLPAGAVPISKIQGVGDSSAVVGETVSIQAIVTGDFQDNDTETTSNLGGFYVQDENPDDSALTSDGIFIYDGNSPAVDVAIGDRVDVSGSVGEYFDETQITATSVGVTGRGSIRPTDIDLPSAGTSKNIDGDAIADLERYEGMLVRFPQKLYVSNLRFLERFGEVGLSQGGRLFQFTNSNAADARAYASYKQAIAARSVVLDDGMRSSYPSTIPHLNAGAANDYSIRTGDSISGVTGNLRFSRGSGASGDETWRLMPSDAVSFSNDNPRPGAPAIGGSIRVGSFNVLNFFSNIDNGQSVCGPDGDDNCRGADSAQEHSRQLARTSSALALLDADLVGLMELENNASDSISSIVDALNDRIGDGNYAFVDTGTISDDAIKSGFIYDASSLKASGPFKLLDSSIDSRFKENRNRPVLAQTFEVTSTGAVFTVVVNHLKSKGSSCSRYGDPNLNDGQGNCNLTRTNAAAAIAEWITTDPTGSGDPDFLVIGDLNAYFMEDPLATLENAGLTNLLEKGSNPYSSVFDGQAGVIDYALASPSLVSQVVAAIAWHINADEPSLLDYNLENGRDAGLFNPDSPYRVSDHDPIVVGLELTN